jgi:hypothetical protein
MISRDSLPARSGVQSLHPALRGHLHRCWRGEAKVATTVSQHAGDIPAGTLRAIERDLEPALGKGWLR